jgi:hypothetical protein
VDGPVLGPVEDLDQVALVRLATDLAHARPEREESLYRGAVGGVREGLDPVRHTFDHPFRDRVDRVVLRREIEVERALRDPCGTDDVVDRGRADAL